VQSRVALKENRQWQTNETAVAKKAGEGEQAPKEEHEGVAAPVNKERPGHAQDAEARQKYQEETEGRR